MNIELETCYASEKKRIQSLSDGRGDYLHPVFGEGNRRALVMFIGEAPGAEEASSGRPFVGKAGRQLDELLSRANIPRSEVFITNTVKYRPVQFKTLRASNRTPSAKEIASGLGVLKDELIAVSPRYVCTLGNTPLKAMQMLGCIAEPLIGSVHGQFFATSFEDVHFDLFPLYHPASSIYNRALAEVMQNDINYFAGHIKLENEMEV